MMMRNLEAGTPNHKSNCTWFNFLWVCAFQLISTSPLLTHSLNRSPTKMTEKPPQSPDTGQEELHIYLSSPLFSQKITCPRTYMTVSFSQIGDPEGCPVLFIPPAVCSRWFAVPLGMSFSPSLTWWQEVRRLEADDRSNMSLIGNQVDFNRSTGMWSHATRTHWGPTWYLMSYANMTVYGEGADEKYICCQSWNT